jgi:hypothetical protein
VRNQFRVTLWFKKGFQDADEARQRAESDDSLHPGAVDLLPSEDRYLDDGTVSREDSKLFSLHTGNTQMVPKLVGGVATGSSPMIAMGKLDSAKRASDGGDVRPLVADLRRGRVKLVAAIAAAAVAGVVAVLVLF